MQIYVWPIPDPREQILIIETAVPDLSKGKPLVHQKGHEMWGYLQKMMVSVSTE
jgi:hypothetical protein